MKRISLLVLLSALALLLAAASARGSGSGSLVVTEVYAAGGNSGAAYANDYVELFNRGAGAVAIDGWTLQYASAASTSWAQTALSGSIPAGGRYLVQLTGISRFAIAEELEAATPYRQCRVSYTLFADDFVARKGEQEVDRSALLKALSAFLEANKLKADWDGIENAPNEALVNALAMMSPYGPAEKQALLEAPDLKTRAEILVALTEIELAKGKTPGETPLQ